MSTETVKIDGVGGAVVDVEDIGQLDRVNLQRTHRPSRVEGERLGRVPGIAPRHVEGFRRLDGGRAHVPSVR